MAALSEPVWRAARGALHLSWLRWRNRHLPWYRRQYQRFRGRRALRVQLGGGHHRVPGYVNLDSWPYAEADLVGDLRSPLPFDTGSVRAIVMEHLLEHLSPYADVPRLLAECRRVLQPGGRVRIIVPDGERALRAYAAGDRAWLVDQRNAIEWLVARSEKGRPFDTPMEALNEIAHQDGEHRFLYDFDTLALRLRDAGFQEVQRSACQASPDPALRVDQAWRAFESLYVEAVR